MTNKLKSCPFCGGIPYEVDSEHTANGLNGVICGVCDVRVFSKSIETARGKWNARIDSRITYLNEYQQAIFDAKLKAALDDEGEAMK